jgi:sigma-B regulation protein RsbU (phosphoserine phosphatase)
MASGSDPNILRRMASDIRRRRDLEEGLNIAQRRQQVMLPDEPALEGYEFASTYDPAADISGDFYDYVKLGSDRVGILVGDVSGHGIEAAIVMGMAKKSLSIFARSSGGPADALSLGNDDLFGDLDSETFLTAIYAVLDGATGRVVLARAGHPLPVLLSPKAKPPHRLIDSQGMMVGMLSGDDFSKGIEEVTLDLEPGDLLFFYTDGLTEARNASGQMFGLDRALRVLESHPRRKPKGQLEAVRQAVGEFRDGREPDDDVTMIAFRRTG